MSNDGYSIPAYYQQPNQNSSISAVNYSAYNISNQGTAPILTGTANGSTLKVNGDAEFDGNIKWKGRDLAKLLESIEDRLAILQDPDPAKLEKFAALRKAYEHYKTLERLIGDD